MSSISSSTLTVVTATTCSVLGLLLLVMALVILQRRIRPCRPGIQSPPPPPYHRHSQPTEAEVAMPARAVVTGDEHDRVALIQFADGVQIALPSYEEAVRSNRGAPRLSRFSSERSSVRSEYRPLPNIPPGLRNASSPHHHQQPPAADSHHHHQRDHHRNSIITTASTTTSTNTRDNLSLAFGSMDTMNVSDATSTSITIGTYDSGASNPSIAMSQRATAGSLGSSNGSLANEGKH